MLLQFDLLSFVIGAVGVAVLMFIIMIFFACWIAARAYEIGWTDGKEGKHWGKEP
jgi:hypothetical protein